MGSESVFKATLPSLPVLPSKWSWLPLGMLATESIKYGIVQPGKDIPGGTPIVRVTDIRNGRINTRKPLRVSPSISDRHSRTKLLGGELLLSVVGSLGETAIVPPTLRGWNVNRAVAVIKLNDRWTTMWVRHCLRTPLLKHYMETWANTTVQKTFNLRDVAQLPIACPPMGEQRAITHILGTLDDKIELNRKKSETLEAMARALFKSWFVDFDPVRAKMEGRWKQGESLPGMPAYLWELFPDKLVDSELGEIPEGWGIKALRECCSIVDCLHSKKPAEMDAGPLLIQLYNVTGDGQIEFSTPYHITEKDYKNWTKRMEILPGDLVITKTGRVGAVGQMPSGHRAAMGRNLVGVRAKPGVSSAGFIRDLLLSDFMRREMVSNTNDGTILRSLHVKAIEVLRCVLPPADLIDAYDKKARAMHLGIEACNKESSILGSLRDTLLPKLISGELRVSEAQQITEGV